MIVGNISPDGVLDYRMTQPDVVMGPCRKGSSERTRLSRSRPISPDGVSWRQLQWRNESWSPNCHPGSAQRHGSGDRRGGHDRNPGPSGRAAAPTIAKPAGARHGANVAHGKAASRKTGGATSARSRSRRTTRWDSAISALPTSLMFDSDQVLERRLDPAATRRLPAMAEQVGIGKSEVSRAETIEAGTRVPGLG